MKSHPLFLALFSLALLSLPAAASAQCSRSGSELIVDGGFTNNCSNWIWSGATRSTGSSTCYSTGASAKFLHGDDEVDQNTIADAGGSNFTLSYIFMSVAFKTDELGNINFVIHDSDADTWTQADQTSVWGQNICQSKSVSLGSHPEWVNHHLELIFYSGFSYIYPPTGRIYVMSVSLTQTN
jgi:hypothetical protein